MEPLVQALATFSYAHMTHTGLDPTLYDFTVRSASSRRIVIVAVCAGQPTLNFKYSRNGRRFKIVVQEK